MRVVGVDIGGTFTDFALYDSETDEVASTRCARRRRTRPRRWPSGFAELCARAGVDPGDVDGVLHGTTVATNAVLEHRGALTGLVTTEGMRDVVHIGRHQRPQAYSVMQDIPWQARPFVQRAHRLCVRERIAPPDGAALVAARRGGRARGRARAARRGRRGRRRLLPVLLPEPGARAARGAILAEELPGCFISTSAATSPQFREFERFTTACMNSFVGPGTSRYLERLGDELRERGAGGELLVMRSNGGPRERRRGGRAAGHADAVRAPPPACSAASGPAGSSATAA